jgi:hypothetical protein
MRVTYGREQEGGKATMVSFHQQRADEVRSELGKWAEQNITKSAVARPF